MRTKAEKFDLEDPQTGSRITVYTRMAANALIRQGWQLVRAA